VGKNKEKLKGHEKGFAECKRIKKLRIPCKEGIERERKRIRTCIVEEENTKPLKSLTRAVVILLRFSYNCQLTNANC